MCFQSCDFNTFFFCLEKLFQKQFLSVLWLSHSENLFWHMFSIFILSLKKILSLALPVASWTPRPNPKTEPKIKIPQAHCNLGCLAPCQLNSQIQSNNPNLLQRAKPYYKAMIYYKLSCSNSYKNVYVSMPQIETCPGLYFSVSRLNFSLNRVYLRQWHICILSELLQLSL